MCRLVFRSSHTAWINFILALLECFLPKKVLCANEWHNKSTHMLSVGWMRANVCVCTCARVYIQYRRRNVNVSVLRYDTFRLDLLLEWVKILTNKETSSNVIYYALCLLLSVIRSTPSILLHDKIKNRDRAKEENAPTNSSI